MSDLSVVGFRAYWHIRSGLSVSVRYSDGTNRPELGVSRDYIIQLLDDVAEYHRQKGIARMSSA